MDVRRIVTGTRPTGAAIVRDDSVRPVRVGLMPGAEFHSIWGSDVPPVLPTDGSQPEAKAWLPPPSGYRFGLFTLGPSSAVLPHDFDLVAGITEVASKLPGMVEVLEPDHPGMHTTNTVDYVVVLSGAAWLEVDDGERVLVSTGETVVQNGTRHAWHNAGEEPCLMAVALIGATRAPSER